ncbi:molybdopterin-binding protein [Nocardioides sp. GCM10028917]|uniref:TOBE domain-containing protein n=1 Tax=Nocardioides sp. GCM10028917 TaxID=3273408 RepID=UPI00360BFBAF
MGTRLSIRNQFAGTVTAITSGGAMSVVKVELSGGQSVTSAITRESIEGPRDRGGQPGDGSHQLDRVSLGVE